MADDCSLGVSFLSEICVLCAHERNWYNVRIFKRVRIHKIYNFFLYICCATFLNRHGAI